MDAIIAEGKLGVLPYKLEVKGGDLFLNASLPADAVAAEIKKLIPGSIDDFIVDLLLRLIKQPLA